VWQDIFVLHGVQLYCQAEYTDRDVHLLWTEVIDDVKEGKLLFPKSDMQKRCLCPCIRQLQGWHLNMAVYTWGELENGHEVSHTL
jgi:hypothetical protein